MARDVLVDGRTLFVGRPDRAGVPGDGDGGLIHRDTRHLSALSATLDAAETVAVGRDLEGSNRRTVVSAALDSAVNRVDEAEAKRTDVVVRETQAVAEAVGLAGRVEVANHSRSAFEGRLTVAFEVDFADVFEVRGFAGTDDRRVRATVEDRSVRFAHDYEDEAGEPVALTTTVTFGREPVALDDRRAVFDLAVPSQGSEHVAYAVEPGVEPERGQRAADPAVDAAADPPTVGTVTDAAAGPVAVPAVPTGDSDRDRVFRRAAADLAALVTETEYGPVPVAGVPWFATVFGRDSLVAAYQALPVAPSLAAGTLRYLAAHRGTTTDEAREEAPGKVFHEIREGELARRGVVPHGPYYGSVDATPLWVVLLAEYHRWTGDSAFVRRLADALDDALSWVERARGGGSDPFLAYESSPAMGLLHKAWRDTPGAVQFPDGDLAEPPIASVEVQGYVYRALRDAAALYETVLDDPGRAADLRARASDLAAAFESAFWLPGAEYYAVAQSADGVVPTATSNVGHCLWAGVVDEDRAPAVARRLRSDALNTGWGLRTMTAEAAGYSPVSYHLGSVWPHDTSLAALGLARYGFGDDAERLARGVLDAGATFEAARIPELFCGFDDDTAPKPYPSSCVPQAWSAAAPYAFLRAAFALEPTDDGVSAGRSPALFPDGALDVVRRRWSA
jgi:glycogen debranching enzyme